jgi:hypothetical protein
VKIMALLGESKNIIVGAAQVFIAEEGPLVYSSASANGSGSAAIYNFSGTGTTRGYPNAVANTKYADTLEGQASWRNVGYTMNGLEIQFQPDFGEVQVDQLLDVARMFKQGMQVNLVTAFAEATLENLLVATAGNSIDLQEGPKVNGRTTTTDHFNLQSGNLGEVPLERAIIAIGPGSGDPTATGNSAFERIYVGLRVLSIESVTVTAKRDEASMFEVTFRLMPASNGSYGKIVDRVVSYAGAI